MSKLVIPLPSRDFDPTEAAVAWKVLTENGIAVVFATEDARAATGDPRMVSGKGLGIWAPFLRANPDGQRAYREMLASPEFNHPIRWQDIEPAEFSGVVLPGGHAPGMKPYLESPVLQERVARFLETKKLVAAICHGVVLAARSKDFRGVSILHGRKATALLRSQEMTAWALTCAWLKNYYRTYPESVQAEVTRNLGSPANFAPGPTPWRRDSPARLDAGFVVQDGNLISARWPGDAHRFGAAVVEYLTGTAQPGPS